MVSPASFFERASQLAAQWEHPIPGSDLRALRTQISALANEILHTAGPDSIDANNALSLIGRVTRNVFPRTPQENLFLNLRDRIGALAPDSVPYPEKLQTPFIASYHSSGLNNKMMARLDGAAIWDQIPSDILRCLGSGLDPAQVDVFLVQNNCGFAGYERVEGDYYGGHYDTLQHELLLKFHQWAFPDLPPGGDIHKQLYMGAFPDFGIYRAQHDPAPINYMEGRAIHAHPDHGGRDMLYSPNGAHIAIDTDSPFSSFWMVAREGPRACIAKVLLLHYKPETPSRETDPLFDDYFALSAKCRSLEEYAIRLNNFAPHIQSYAQQVWGPYLAAIQIGDLAGADRIFLTLPRTFQSAFHKQLWILKGRPEGHGDFGKLCYDRSETLPEELKARPEDRITAANLVQAEMFRVLVTEPLELLELKIPEARRAEVIRTAAHTPGADHPLQGGSGDSSLARASASQPSTSPDVRSDPNTQIEESLASLLWAKQNHASKAEIEGILERLNRFTEGRIASGQKASDRLFTLVYECHNMAMEQFELQEPTHPEFGRAAFFGEEGANTHPEVIEMALAALTAELLPRA